MWARQAWGGFFAGRLAIILIDDYWGGGNERRCPAIFTNKKEAKRQFRDVRPVGITELLPVPRRKPR